MIIQGQNINLKLSEQDIHVMLLEPCYFRPEGSRTVHNCSEALRRGHLLVPEPLSSEKSVMMLSRTEYVLGKEEQEISPKTVKDRQGNQSRSCKDKKSVLTPSRTGNWS